MFYLKFIIQDELAKHDETIKQLKENIEWGEETLLAWNNDLARRNDEVNLLESYHLEDIKRFKVIELPGKNVSWKLIINLCYSGIR